MAGHTPPHWLNKIAKIYWRKFQPLLEMTETNRAQLALLCDAYSTYRAAAELVELDGIVTVGSTGQTREHPANVIKGKASDQIRRLTAILFSSQDVTETEDDLDQFMGGA